MPTAIMRNEAVISLPNLPVSLFIAAHFDRSIRSLLHPVYERGKRPRIFDLRTEKS